MSENRQFSHYRLESAVVRRAECACVTTLMNSDRSSSFLRLGDTELMFLTAVQSGTEVGSQDTIDVEKFDDTSTSNRLSGVEEGQ